MKKYLVIYLTLLSTTILGQGNSSKDLYINSTQDYNFTNLGESVSDLFFDPEIEGRLVAATSWYSDEGVKISTDNGETWDTSSINTSKPKQYIKATSIAFDPSNLDVGYLAAGFDLFKTSDRGTTWDSTNMFPDWYVDINYVVYHPLDSNVLFVSNFYPYYNVVLLYKSIDGGITWGVSDSTQYTKMVFNKDNLNIIYGVALYTTIKKSNNFGETWENINNNLISKNGGRFSLEISEKNSNVLYLGQMNDVYGSDNWILSMTTNGGESWERIDSTLKEINPEGSMYSILLDENIEGRFYISYTGGLFLTEDNGKHYQKIYSGNTGKIWSDNNNPPNIYFNTDEGLLRIMDTLTVGVKTNTKNIPSEYILSQNYPNPFNPSTTIKYTIPVATRRGVLHHVTLKVYDILGREVATLVNEEQSGGSYEVTFNASAKGIHSETSSAVGGLTSGIYFYKITSGEFIDSKKMLILK